MKNNLKSCPPTEEIDPVRIGRLRTYTGTHMDCGGKRSATPPSLGTAAQQTKNKVKNAHFPSGTHPNVPKNFANCPSVPSGADHRLALWQNNPTNPRKSPKVQASPVKSMQKSLCLCVSVVQTCNGRHAIGAVVPIIGSPAGHQTKNHQKCPKNARNETKSKCI